MELNRDKVIRELDKLHYYILNTNLAERISDRDIMTIINAATLLVEDEKRIKEAIHKTIESVRAKGKRNAYACMISGEFHENYIIQESDLTQIEEDMVKRYG